MNSSKYQLNTICRQKKGAYSSQITKKRNFKRSYSKKYLRFLKVYYHPYPPISAQTNKCTEQLNK